MTIKIQQKETELLVAPEGQLDSVAAPELDKAIKESISGMTSVILDFLKVDYISSAGLRVVLSTEQTMEEEQGEFKLIHVNDEVMEILELTGLADILTIE